MLSSTNIASEEVDSRFGDIRTLGALMTADDETTPHEFVREPRPDYVPWIAAAAVVAGAVGALLGFAHFSSLRRRRPGPGVVTSADSHGLTPPHGDKLMPRA
jgi:hypothetical protein